MVRAAWIFAVTSVVAAAASVWLYLDNRDLRAQLASLPAASTRAASTDKAAAARTVDPWTEPSR